MHTPTLELCAFAVVIITETKNNKLDKNFENNKAMSHCLFKRGIVSCT